MSSVILPCLCHLGGLLVLSFQVDALLKEMVFGPEVQWQLSLLVFDFEVFFLQSMDSFIPILASCFILSVSCACGAYVSS